MIILIPADLFGRAGGGGGDNDSFLSDILLPFLIVNAVIIYWYVWKKNKRAKEIINKSISDDISWDFGCIKKRIEITFYKVQEAWMKRDQDIAKDFVSKKLYKKHKFQTDRMIRKKEKNILEKVNLDQSTLLEVVDRKDDSRDRFWVFIRGSMIDYIINEKTKKIISGDKKEIDHFSELWKFIRRYDNWVLDEIKQNVKISDLKSMHSFRE